MLQQRGAAEPEVSLWVAAGQPLSQKSWHLPGTPTSFSAKSSRIRRTNADAGDRVASHQLRFLVKVVVF